MVSEERQLSDLVSIGPATLRDFELLGVHTVAQLARRNPLRMYEKLCQVTGQAQDICCLDVFRAAVAQAKNPNLPFEQRLWWGAASARPAMPATRKRELTTPDLVLLSLLAEQPLHGYQANAELERREVSDWAGISRPQVYYSIEKLAQFGLVRTYKVRASETDSPTAGPERRVFQTTAKGRAALADALEREEWTTHRERPPFLTWIALSWQARPGVFRKQIDRRRRFLENELSREKATLLSIKKEVGHHFHEAVWMVSLIIEQFRGELRWLQKLERELPRRAAAKHAQ